MPTKGYTWNDEYRKKFYESDKVKDHLEKFIEQASKPKTEQQKAKMSAAKLGRKFSDEHKQNMSEAQKFRNALRKEILEQEPQLAKSEVWIKVREIKENDRTI
jgi:biopolymer transport protein ExbB/TolQ